VSPAARLALAVGALLLVLGLAVAPAAAQQAADKVGDPVVITPISKPPFRGAVADEGREARLALERAAAEGGHRATAAGEGLQNSRGAALLFWLFALGTVGGGLFVITRRNPIAAVMGMVGTFFALAGLYLMLYASFLAAIQVLVYAGAIMVLFVFVIMILNRPEDEPWSVQGLLGKALALVAIAYLTVRLGAVLWDLKDTQHAAVAGPRPLYEIPPGDPGDFGSVRAVGNTLFRDYLFPFEAVSLVLLTAVVGAIAVARPHQKDEFNEADATGKPAGDEAAL
jgi:NADH-quinone oxidoreductase subunit J